MALPPRPGVELQEFHMTRTGDWILLGFAALATIPFIFANAVIFRYRKRGYFRAHGGVELILLGSLAGLVWIVSDFVTNGHFNRRGFFRECVLWGFWFKLSFGLCLWLICIILRLNRMERILNRGREAPGFWSHYLLWILLLMLPNLVVSLAATLSHTIKTGNPSRHNHLHHHRHGFCKFKNEWNAARYFLIPPLYFLGVLVFLCRLRRQKDTLVRREYVHTCDCCIMAFIVYILSAVTYMTSGQRSVEGRCFLTFCVCCMVFIHFWNRMAWPVYLCLFKPESEMDKYEDELRQAGAMIFNAFTISTSGRLDLPSSEEAILHALHEESLYLAKVMEDVNRLEMEKLRLESENRRLEARY